MAKRERGDEWMEELGIWEGWSRAELGWAKVSQAFDRVRPAMREG